MIVRFGSTVVILLYLLRAMPCSALSVAQRAFVKVLLSLAVNYNLAVQVNRDSSPEALSTECRPAVRHEDAQQV